MRQFQVVPTVIKKRKQGEVTESECNGWSGQDPWRVHLSRDLSSEEEGAERRSRGQSLAKERGSLGPLQ